MAVRKKKATALAVPESGSVLLSQDRRDAWLIEVASRDPDMWRVLSDRHASIDDLTEDQRAAIIEAGTGARPDLPRGKDYVKRLYQSTKRPKKDMATRKIAKSKSKLEELAARDPDIRRMLSEPVGTPIKLTREQAIAVVEAGIGADPDGEDGATFVRRIRPMWAGLLSHDSARSNSLCRLS